MVKGSDTSTAESRSEAEDIASSKAIRSFSHLQLTPVREESKLIGSVSYTGSFSGYDEYVPMVDKAVDAVWKRQASFKKPNASGGTPAPPVIQKAPEGYHVRIMAMLMTFFITLYKVLYSVASRVTKTLPEKSSDQIISPQEFAFDTMPREEISPPSSTTTSTQTDLLSSVLKRLGELEETVDTLKAKPSEMPYEKEELLNAAVCRVDALEAELIATKKALHEALMRQEELLAYIDRQEEAKFRKKKSCW